MHVDVAKKPSESALAGQELNVMPCDCATALTLTLFICLFYVFIYLFNLAWLRPQPTPCQQLILVPRSERKKKALKHSKSIVIRVATLKIIFLGKCWNHWIYPVFLLLISHIQCQALFWFTVPVLFCFFMQRKQRDLSICLMLHAFSLFPPPLCAPVGDTHRRVLRCVSEHALLFPFTHSKSLHL